MSDIRYSNLSFTKGIESIKYASQGTDLSLPALGDAPPTDIGMQGQLEQLLQQSTFDSQLNVALRPTIENRESLVRPRFREALAAVEQQLTVVAQSYPEGSQEARQVNLLVRVLGEDLGNHELLRMYDSAVYQG